MSDELKRVGLVFKADGTVDFNKSLKAVNASIQENRSAFKLAKSSWDDSTKSVKKLRETQKYLENQTKDYTDKVRMLETELKELESAENRDEKAISKKKDQLNTAQTSLNNYQKGLDEVSQKLDSGAAEIEEYGKKLEEMGGKMTSAGKKMSKGITAPVLAVGAAGVKSAMELDEGYDTIISKTGATGDKLLEMQDIADEVFGGMPVSMMDVGAAVGEINTRFEFTGDVLKEATKKFLKFAEINETDVNTAVQLVSRAMGDANIPAEEYGTILDQLTAAAQASGISIDTLTQNLTKYGAPMRQLGFDTESSIAIFAQWEKAGVNTEIAFSGMKKAIANWTKEGKDGKAEFANFVKGVQDGSISAQEALDVFGAKAGPDLVDAIQNGRFNYEEFMKIIEESGGIVAKTWEAQQDPWDQAKVAVNNLKLAGAELGEQLMAVLAPIINSVVEKVKEFTEWFKGLDDEQKKTIVTIGLLAAAIGPLLIVFGIVFSSIGKIITVTSKIITIAGKVPGIIGTISTGAKALWGVMAANPIGAVVTVVGLLIAAFVTAYNKCDWFREGVNRIFGGVVDFIKKAIKKIKGFFDFDWELPDIKLPHFSLEGSFSLKKMTVPKLKVDWYAKGGILNSPTIFGSNGDSLMGGGEAGKEAVLPIELLRKYIREENQAGNESLARSIEEALSKIEIVAQNNIYLGDRKLLDLMTDMVIEKIGRRQNGKNAALGVV